LAQEFGRVRQTYGKEDLLAFVSLVSNDVGFVSVLFPVTNLYQMLPSDAAFGLGKKQILLGISYVHPVTALPAPCTKKAQTEHLKSQRDEHLSAVEKLFSETDNEYATCAVVCRVLDVMIVSVMSPSIRLTFALVCIMFITEICVRTSHKTYSCSTVTPLRS